METLSNCPICHSPDLGLRYSGRTTRDPCDRARWRVSECRCCGLGFLNPRPSWEELEPYYSARYAAYSRSHGAKADDHVVIAEARRTGTFRHIPIPDGKRVLDVGCGGGYFLRICSKLGATVQGVEPSPIAAKEARSQGIPVHEGMIDTFETDQRFDIITASQVLEHVPDPVAMLAKMRSLLAPGGAIGLAVPNAELTCRIICFTLDGRAWRSPPSGRDCQFVGCIRTLSPAWLHSRCGPTFGIVISSQRGSRLS